MSKRFEIGEKVKILSAGTTGRIMDFNCIRSQSSKRCTNEFIVKPDGATRLSQWMTCTRRDLQRLNTVKEEKSKWSVNVIFEHEGNECTMTVAALLRRKDNYRGTYINGDCVAYTYNPNPPYELLFGWSICAPGDEFDEIKGAKIALHRAKEHPFSRMESMNPRDFSEETVLAILKTKAQYLLTKTDKLVNFPQDK